MSQGKKGTEQPSSPTLRHAVRNLYGAIDLTNKWVPALHAISSNKITRLVCKLQSNLKEQQRTVKKNNQKYKLDVG